ncbi:MAG: sugar phosphate isomerase/epimerase family protein [Planctomycetota bacterium]
MARFRIGYSTVDWGPDHFLRALQQISELGFAGVEIGTEVVLLFEGREDEFKDLLGRVGLELAAVYAGLVLTDPDYRESDLAIARQAVHLMHEVSKEGVLVVMSGEVEESREESIREAASALCEIAKLAAPLNVRVCVKPQSGSALESGTDLAAMLMEAGDEEKIQVCFDSAHLVLSGTDILLFCAAHAGYIGHVHLTDLRGDMVADLSPLAEHGAGTVPLKSVMETLRASPYQGWIIGRVDTPQRAPRESAMACAEYFRDTLYLPVRGADEPE